ncbi:MAG: 3-keto-5-aminohexanoate cleavage protein [Promethearchaeota archaeon]
MSEEDLSKKLVISAALAGAATNRSMNPAVPFTAEEFGDEAKKCYEAGAAVIHIHARDPEKGNPTHELEIIGAILDNIREKAPEVLINLSTAISTIVTPKQRITPIETFRPPLASLNSNSMNFAVGDHKTGQVGLGAKVIFANTFDTIQKFAKAMKKAEVKPEIEIYDFGGIYNILHLAKQQPKILLDPPLHFQFVFGVLGGVPFSYENLAHFMNLKPPDASWSVCGVAKQQFQAAMCAAPMGGHIRVGLEDNTRMPDGRLAKGSWEQVEWAAKVARIVDREPATPNEARKIFNLYQQ